MQPRSLHLAKSVLAYEFLESNTPCRYIGKLARHVMPSISVWDYIWTGDVAVGDVITFTTLEPQSTIGGAEGTPYTATVVVTDSFGGYVTEPITGTAIGHITHFANLIPTKSAPPEIGPGQTMTYTIQVFDSGFTTEMNPPPVLTETVPASVTLLRISDDGISKSYWRSHGNLMDTTTQWVQGII